MNEYASITPAVRLFAGDGALDRLPGELRRLRAKRAFILCGRSIATRSGLLDRLRCMLGDSYAGDYPRMGKDAPLADVREAAEAARAAGADVLIAVGAGSVLKAARVVAILLAESGEPHLLATQYVDGQPPRSPRLEQPKLPLINVLTAATSAQHRAGAAVRSDDGGPRLEFFDPKTRPAVIFWDSEALMTAPPSLALSTGVSVFWRALMNAGAIRTANPLVQASRQQAFVLAHRALPRLSDPENVAARMDMCAAALLQNRDEDDGGRPFELHWIARVVYALGAALFNRVSHLDQGTTHAVLTAPAIARFGDLCPDVVVEIGSRLGLLPESVGDPASVAAEIRRIFKALGLPDYLRSLSVSPQDLEPALEAAMYNFNADRRRELQWHRDRLSALLKEAYE